LTPNRGVKSTHSAPRAPDQTRLPHELTLSTMQF
jgi:hypothetical protein